MAEPSGIPDGWAVIEGHGAEPHASAVSTPEGSAVGRFASGAWKNLNPMGLVTAATHSVDTAKALLEAHKAQYDKAKEAYGQGRYSEAVGHLGAAALPVLGPAAAEAGEKIGAGDIAGGLGEGVGVIGSVLAPRALGPSGRVVARGARAVARTVNPETAAALVRHGATAGGAVGGPAGAIIGSQVGETLAPHVKAVVERLRPKSKMAAGYEQYMPNKPAPKLETILGELDKDVAPVVPAVAKSSQQVLNEEAIAARRARNAAAPAKEPLGSVEDPYSHPGGSTPAAPGRATHYPGGASTNLTDVELGRVRPYTQADIVREDWFPSERPRTPSAETPIPLSKAVTAVRQAATGAKLKLTATEFSEATRLAKAGRSATDVMDAIAVQRQLKSSSAFAGLPTDAEMRADLGRRARAGQKSLMPAYGDEPAVAGNPFR